MLNRLTVILTVSLSFLSPTTCLGAAIHEPSGTILQRGIDSAVATYRIPKGMFLLRTAGGRYVHSRASHIVALANPIPRVRNMFSVAAHNVDVNLYGGALAAVDGKDIVIPECPLYPGIIDGKYLVMKYHLSPDWSLRVDFAKLQTAVSKVVLPLSLDIVHDMKIGTVYDSPKGTLMLFTLDNSSGTPKGRHTLSRVAHEVVFLGSGASGGYIAAALDVANEDYPDDNLCMVTAGHRKYVPAVINGMDLGTFTERYHCFTEVEGVHLLRVIQASITPTPVNNHNLQFGHTYVTRFNKLKLRNTNGEIIESCIDHPVVYLGSNSAGELMVLASVNLWLYQDSVLFIPTCYGNMAPGTIEPAFIGEQSDQAIYIPELQTLIPSVEMILGGR